jgi:hypothetical protein
MVDYDYHDYMYLDEEEFTPASWWERWLAGGGEPTRIDYSVLSVTVLTLGILMIVEVVRHRIDHAAVGRPFFETVLEGVYAERKFFVRFVNVRYH